MNILRKVNENCNFCSHLLENQLRKHKGISSNFPEGVDILLCIINHFTIIYSNQMNKKRCFQELHFRLEIMSLMSAIKQRLTGSLDTTYPEMTG